MTYIGNKDFALEVAKGNVSKHSVELKFGRNPDVDTAASEDIWTAGGNLVEPTAARIHSVVSSSANDASAGTGLRTLTIVGLDSSYNIQSETITMNGVTPVNTVNSYTFINRAYGKTFGGGGTNAGTITGTALVDATVQFVVGVGYGQTHKAIYMVPASTKGYITRMYGSFQQTTASSTLDIIMYTKDFGSGGYIGRRNMHLTNSGSGFAEINFNPYLQIAAKTIVKLRAETASANNNEVGGGFDMYIVQD